MAADGHLGVGGRGGVGGHGRCARHLAHALAAPQRMFVRVAGCSHFMQFERARHLLYRATSEWLTEGAFMGNEAGEYAADTAGRLYGAAA